MTDLIEHVCFLIQVTKPLHVIEVGTGLGESAVRMSAVMPTEGLIVTIEPQEALAELAEQAFNNIETGCKIVLRCEDPLQLLETWAQNPQENDMVIINSMSEGSHDRRARYIQAAKALLKPNGILVQQLQRPYFCQVVKPVSETVKDDPTKWPSPHRRTLYKDLLFNTVERQICKDVMPNTLASLDAIISLVRSVKYIIKNDIPGAFVECGVWKGGNIQAIIETLMSLGVTDRDIYLYDTFDGFPKPGIQDYEFGVGPALDRWDSRRDGDKTTGSKWLKVDFDEIVAKITSLGYPIQRLHFVKGMIEWTIPGIPKLVPDIIALARFDTDFYSSTKHEFTHLYPRVSLGGIVIIDDYGTWQGSKQATDEYIKENNLKVYLNRIDEHVRLIVKSHT